MRAFGCFGLASRWRSAVTTTGEPLLKHSRYPKFAKLLSLVGSPLGSHSQDSAQQLLNAAPPSSSQRPMSGSVSDWHRLARWGFLLESSVSGFKSSARPLKPLRMDEARSAADGERAPTALSRASVRAETCPASSGN